jgi:hypothetical protein
LVGFQLAVPHSVNPISHGCQRKEKIVTKVYEVIESFRLHRRVVV